MNKKIHTSLVKLLVGLVFFIFVWMCIGISLVLASIDDIKPVICESINLNGTNCTDWWNTLNLTDANLTQINIDYHEHNYDYRNETIYEGNKTYVQYNSTLNQSYLDNRYLRDIDLPDKLKTYALKTDLSSLNNTEKVVEIQPSKFTWWNVVTSINGVLIVALIVFMIFVVREINYIEEEI